jgi:hypothetical protein
MAGDRARPLVLGELGDAARVPLLPRERLGEEQVDEVRGLLERVLAGADRADVRVVVLAGEQRGRLVPDERRADTLDLVRRDLLAVAGAAEDDAQRLHPCGLVVDHADRRVDAERGVVVERLVGGGAVVDDLVALRLQMPLEVLREVESGVVRAEVHPHASNPMTGRPGCTDGGEVGAEHGDHG